MSLTTHEEEVLRRLARDNMPMQSVNPIPTPQRNFNTVPQAMLDRWKKAPKLQTYDINDDIRITYLLATVGFKGKPGEFYSRVGIGREQLIQMSHDDIRAAIARATERMKNGDDVPPPTTTTTLVPKPNPMPSGPVAVMV